MGWSLTDLIIAFVTVVGLPASLLIGVVGFGVGYLWLYLNGLVSAVIWLIGGVLLLGLLRLVGVFTGEIIAKNPKMMFLLGIPVVAFMIGYASERLPALTVLSISLNSYTALGPMSLQGDIVSFFLTPQIVALVCLVLLGASLVLSYKLVKTKQKYRWVK
jgi:hypothetical protein